MENRTYTVDYDGKIYTRTTRNDYRFISIRNGRASWHSTEALAQAKGGTVVSVPQAVVTKITFEGPESVRTTEAEYHTSGVRKVFEAATADDPEDKMGDIAWSLERANEIADEFGIEQGIVRAFVRGERAHI